MIKKIVTLLLVAYWGFAGVQISVALEKDDSYWKEYHYGDPDIIITPESEFTFNAGTGTITGYSGTNATVVIPYEIGGVSVVTIGTYAFGMVSTLRNVTTPFSVKTVGDGAFAESFSLNTVDFRGVETIESYGLYQTAVVTLSIPCVTSIGDHALEHMFSLTGVNFSGSPPSFGVNLYTDAPSVTNYVPSTATGWGDTFGGRPVVRISPPVGTVVKLCGTCTSLESGGTGVRITVAAE